MARASATVTVDSKRVEAALTSVSAAVNGRAVKNGLRAGVRTIANAAIQRVQQPGSSGYYEATGGVRKGRKASKPMLRQSIGYVVREPRTGVLEGRAGPTWRDGAHGHLLEGGHRQATGGTIVSRREEALQKLIDAGRLTVRQKRSIAGWVHRFRKSGKSRRVHQGKVVGFVAPRPFLSPAVQAVGQQAADKMIRSITTTIKRAATIAAKGGE